MLGLKFVRALIHGTELKADVYVELGASLDDHIDGDEKQAHNVGSKPKLFIARVDLGKLGRAVAAQRRKGHIQHLYVVGQMPPGFTSSIADRQPNEECIESSRIFTEPPIGNNGLTIFYEPPRQRKYVLSFGT
jgi:hypothetical protein